MNSEKLPTQERACEMRRQAFSIGEFCSRHGISRAHYFNLQTRGQGPNVLRAGARVLITPEAEAAWRKALEANQLEGRLK